MKLSSPGKTFPKKLKLRLKIKAIILSKVSSYQQPKKESFGRSAGN
jgi:hypothetical protein